MRGVAGALWAVWVAAACVPPSAPAPQRDQAVALAATSEELAALIARGARRIRLGAGVFRGSFELPQGQGPFELEGAGSATWLIGPAGKAALVVHGQATVRRVTLAGQALALAVPGQLTLSQARVRVVGGTGIEVEGALTAAEVEVRALGAAETSAGILTRGAGTLSARRLAVLGRFARGLELRGRAAALDDGVIAGAAAAVHHRAGSCHLVRLSIAAGPHGKQAAILSAAEARLEQVRITGAHTGISVTIGGTLTADSVDVHRSRADAVVLVRSRGTFRRLRVGGADGPALVMVGAAARIERGWLHDATDFGALVRNGQLIAERTVFSATRLAALDVGDGLHLRASRVWLVRSSVVGAGGLCALAAESAALHLLGVLLDGCGGGGVLATGHGRVEAEGLLIRRTNEVGAIALDFGTLALHRAELSVETGEPLGADCAQGAKIELSSSVSLGTAVAPQLPCVVPWNVPRIEPPPTELSAPR